MGYPIKPSGVSVPRLRLGRTSTVGYSGNSWASLAWQTVLDEQAWGGAVTTLPASTIDVYEPGRYAMLVGLARKAVTGGFGNTQFRWTQNGSTDLDSGRDYTMLGGNVMSPFYWWRLTDTFTGPGTILVEYLCVRSHDIIADPETFLDIVRISD